MPESHHGRGKTISELQSTAQYFNLRQYDTIVLSFLCNFRKVTKSVYPYLYSIDKG